MTRFLTLAALSFSAFTAMAQGPARDDILAQCPQLAEQLPEQLASIKQQVGTAGTVREALAKFPDAVIAVWIPQIQRLEAAELPQRLINAMKGVAKKGWLHAQLTVAAPQDGGFGLMGSSMVVANPPHTLGILLAQELPWLAERLGQFKGAKGTLTAGS